jgi:hypothetical protein
MHLTVEVEVQAGRERKISGFANIERETGNVVAGETSEPQEMGNGGE